MDHSSSPPQRTNPDEISLREIYLIIKRGFWFIVVFAFILAVLGFLYGTLQSPSYESQSSTSISPSSINVQDTNGVSLSPRTNIPYQAYERLALSSSVLEAVLTHFPDIDLNVDNLRGIVSVSEVLGATQQNPQMAQFIPLITEHRVRHTDPELAAALTRTWVDETLAMVRQTLSNNLEPVNSVTEEQQNQLRSNLDVAANSLEVFRVENNLTLSRMLFESLTSRVANERLELNDLQREIAVAVQRQGALQQQLEEESNKVTSASSSDAFLAGLSLQEARATLESQLERANSAFAIAQANKNTFILNNNLNVLSTQILNYESDLADLPFEVLRLDDELAQLRSAKLVLDAQLANESSKVASSDALDDMFLAGLSLEQGQSFLDDQLELARNNFEQARQARDDFNENVELGKIQTSLDTYQEELIQIPFDIRDNQDELDLEESRSRLLQAQLARVRNNVTSIDLSSPQYWSGLDIPQVEELLQNQLTIATDDRTGRRNDLNVFDQTYDLNLMAEQITYYETQLAELPFTLDDIDAQIDAVTAQEALLTEQLQEESAKVTSSNSLSDEFISGLTLQEARGFLAQQHTLANNNFISAQQNLNDFDNTNNLTVLNAQIDALEERVTGIPFTLSDLELRQAIESNLLTVLDEQLESLRKRTSTSDAASDGFLVGRTIGDAQAIIATQLAQAQQARTVARLALDGFDQQHDLEIRQADIDNLRDRLVEKNARFEELPGEIDIVRNRLVNLEQQLAEQPPLLELRNTVIGNDVLREVTRQEEGTIFNSELVSEIVNQVHSDLLSDVLSKQVEFDNLLVEQSVLEQQLVVRREELNQYVQQLIDLRRERADLVIQLDQAKARYNGLLDRLEQFEYALLDPGNAERLLVESIDTTNLPATFDIESQQREIMGSLQSLESERQGLEERLSDAMAQLPSLRGERIRLSDERQRLMRRVEETQEILDAVQARMDNYALSELDPRGERIIVRDTTPEVIELQSTLRGIARDLLELQNNRTDSESRLAEAETLLPDLRQQHAELTQERELLEFSYRLANDNFQELIDSIDMFNRIKNDPRGLERIFQESNIGDFEDPAAVIQRELRASERMVSELQAKRDNLNARLAEAEQRVPSLRREAIVLSSQQNEINARYTLTETALREVEARIDGFARSMLDPRSNRSLRDNTPAVLSLQSELRDLARQENDLEQSRRAFTSRISTAESELPQLLETQTRLNAELDLLDFELNQAEETRNTLRNRLETFRYNTAEGMEARILRDTTPEVLELQKLLRDADISLTVLRSRLASLQQQLAEDETALLEKQREVAVLSERQSQLESELTIAREAYNDILGVIPTIKYLSEIASVSTQVISEAAVPSVPTNTSRVFLGIIAGFIGGLIGLILVFVNAAIRDPNEPPSNSSRQGQLVATTAIVES